MLENGSQRICQNMTPTWLWWNIINYLTKITLVCDEPPRVLSFLIFNIIKIIDSNITSYLTKCGSTSLCDQSCGVQPGDRQTAHVTWTDKSLKTEGPKILSNHIFYFKTVIIGGPIQCDYIFLFQSISRRFYQTKRVYIGAVQAPFTYNWFASCINPRFCISLGRRSRSYVTVLVSEIRRYMLGMPALAQNWNLKIDLKK